MEVVEDKISGRSSRNKHQMMFAGGCYDLAEEKVAHRPASRQKFMTFANGIVVAITESRVDCPSLAGKAVFVSLRPNTPIDIHVDLDEFIKALIRYHRGARLRCFRTFHRRTVLRIALAEQSISHGSELRRTEANPRALPSGCGGASNKHDGCQADGEWL